MEGLYAFPQDRRILSATTYALLAAVVAAGLIVHPLLGWVLGVGVAGLIVVDWRVPTLSAVGLFGAMLLVVPADINIPVGLPFDLTADRLILMLLFGGIALGVIELPWEAPALALSRVGAPLKALLAVAVISLLINGSRTVESGYFLEQVKSGVVLLVYVAVYFLAVAAARESRRRDVENVLRMFVAAGAVASVSAIVERLTQTNPIRAALLAIPLLQPNSVYEEGLVRGGLRVAGTAEHPIAFGGAMAMLLPIAMYFVLNSKGKRMVGWLVATGLIFLGMLFTVSRSSLLSAMVCAVVLFFAWPRKRQMMIALALVGLFAVHMAVPGLLGTFLATLDPDFIQRQESVQGASTRFNDYPLVKEIIPRQPLFGLGYNEFDPQRYFYLDNQLLKFVLELGLAGILSLGFFFGRAASALRRGIKGASGDDTPLEGALLGSMCAFAVLSFFFDTFAFEQVTYLFFMLAGFGVAMSFMPRAEDGGELAQ